MDTAPAASGKNIKPRVIKNYDGAEIVLNAEKKIVMKPEDFPSLKQYVGQDLVVTDGLTLLGGDDKAGVAEIMTAAEYLLSLIHIFTSSCSCSFSVLCFFQHLHL